MEKIPQRKKLKSLTLPATVAEQLQELAAKKECKQNDLVTVALLELFKLNNKDLNQILIENRM